MEPLHIRSKVLQIQSWIRQFVGDGVRANLEWDRTGAQLFELLGGDRTQWTTLAIFGRTGGFRMSAPQSRLLIDEASLRYEVRGDDLALDVHCLAKGLASRLSPADPAAVGSGEPVGFPGLTGLMTIVSILSFVWQLIHPQVSLTLPGSVGCQMLLTGDTLTIDLLRPLPSLKIQAFFTFTPSLSRITVTPDAVRFQFEGSRIEERTIQIV
jgi:hypothetical protein